MKLNVAIINSERWWVEGGGGVISIKKSFQPGVKVSLISEKYIKNRYWNLLKLNVAIINSEITISRRCLCLKIHLFASFSIPSLGDLRLAY